MVMMSDIEFDTIERQSVLVYGPPKVGKTQLVGKLAEIGWKLLWIDVENGWKTLKYNLSKEAWKNINLIPIPDSRTNPMAIQTLTKIFTGQRVTVCFQHGVVGCLECSRASKPATEIFLNKLPMDTIVVVDSLSQLTNSVLNYIIKGNDDMYKPTFHDYRVEGVLLDKILSQVQAAKYNVAFISHDISVEIPGTKKEDGTADMRTVPLGGTTNFSKMVAKYFDTVCLCEISGRKHRAGTDTLYRPYTLTGSRTNVNIAKEGVGLEAIFGLPPDLAVSTSQDSTGAGTEEVPHEQAVEAHTTINIVQTGANVQDAAAKARLEKLAALQASKKK